MSLLTVERNSPSPQESDAEETLSSSSHEGFVAREHYVTSLPPRPWASLGRHGGEQLRIFTHLKKVMKLLRSSDTIKLAVELENSSPRKVTKHLVLVVTNGYQDTEEAIVLGTEQEDSVIRLGLVLPLWRDTEIKLDGDGGFIVHSGDRQAVFKPSSVQSMWTTLQSLYQSTENARLNNYYVGGLSHTWMSFYHSQLTDDYIIRNEWNLMKDITSFRPDSPLYCSHIPASEADRVFEKQLVSRLRGIMLHEDLEEVTSRQLRGKLEEQLEIQLTEYREFLDRHMLQILGQLEQPSKILDYLYLGTEWNASNLSELKGLGVGYILNVTREIDNFYPEVFKYLNIRLYDVPDSELIKHWDNTYRFIKEAKMMGTKVLVHCKMGISRSAATVIAYMMKEYQMALTEAKKLVKSIRGCINPNDGFMGQLRSYEGILTARHNPRWGRHAPTRLHTKRSMSDPDLMQSLQKEDLERGMAREGEGEGETWEEGDAVEDQFMHSRPIHNVASACNIPSLLHAVEEPELNFLPEEELVTHDTQVQPDPSTTSRPASEYLSKKNALIHSTPVDKNKNLQHFLASLPPLPVVVGSTDDGIGENIPTSNSGSAYSSPMYTPPDEESIHMHMSQHREQQKREEEEEEGEGGEAVQERQGALATNNAARTDDSMSSRQQPQSQTSQGSPVLKPALAPLSPPSPKLSSPPQTQLTASASNTVRPQLQRDSAVDVAGISHAQRSSSVPFALVHDDISGAKKPRQHISPTNSRQALSSLARWSPAVPEDKEEGKEVISQCTAGGGNVAPSDKLVGAAEDKKWSELCGDSSQESMTPRTRERFMHHRRTKSDSHDMSGPIKTAQISSVPERVREIEEKGFQVTTAQLLQAVNQIDSQSCPPNSHLPSPSSSEECLAPLASNTPSDQDKSHDHSFSPKISADSLTRHTSLSPKPSSAAIAASPHFPVQTSLSLPSSISPPELDTGSAQPVISQDELVSSLQGVVKAKVQDIEGKQGMVGEKQAASNPETRVTSSDAVIKRASAQRPLSEIIFHSPYIGMVETSDPSDSESQVSISSGREVVDSSAQFKVHRRSTSSSVRGFDSGSSSHKVHRRNTTCEMLSSSERCSESGSRIQSDAVFNAWAGILPTEDLHADDLASVLELKQIFEKKSPKEPRRLLSNLRRSRSLRDTRLLSPPVRLGGSARWKKHSSSNASLQWSEGRHRRDCTSASPPAHSSHQSLSSSVRM